MVVCYGRNRNVIRAPGKPLSLSFKALMVMPGSSLSPDRPLWRDLFRLGQSHTALSPCFCCPCLSALFSFSNALPFQTPLSVWLPLMCPVFSQHPSLFFTALFLFPLSPSSFHKQWQGGSGRLCPSWNRFLAADKCGCYHGATWWLSPLPATSASMAPSFIKKNVYFTTTWVER